MDSETRVPKYIGTRIEPVTMQCFPALLLALALLLTAACIEPENPPLNGTTGSVPGTAPVTFYLDSNGNGTLDVGADSPITTVTPVTGDGYTD